MLDQAYAIAAAEADEAGTMRILEQHSVAAFRQRDYARVETSPSEVWS